MGNAAAAATGVSCVSWPSCCACAANPAVHPSLAATRQRQWQAKSDRPRLWRRGPDLYFPMREKQIRSRIRIDLVAPSQRPPDWEEFTSSSVGATGHVLQQVAA